jgi:acyl-CoA dehydrogenase
VSGDIVTAIAMTEPGTGSDLAAIATTARRDGDHYVLNGAKTFITNGILCDLCVVAARSEPGDNPHQNISLFVVEAGTPGFTRARSSRRWGWPRRTPPSCSSRTAACRRRTSSGSRAGLPDADAEAAAGAPGGGRSAAQAGAEVVLADTIKYVQERKAFGKPIAKFQNTQFKLAECATEVEVGRVFLDR